jgi:hypothetical protein
MAFSRGNPAEKKEIRKSQVGQNSISASNQEPSSSKTLSVKSTASKSSSCKIRLRILVIGLERPGLDSGTFAFHCADP